MASRQRRASHEAEARFKPRVMEVFLTVAVRTSAGPGPGHKRLAPSLQDLLARVDNPGAMAIRGVRDPERRWVAMPPGGTLRLFRPPAREFFSGTREAPRPANDQYQPVACVWPMLFSDPACQAGARDRRWSAPGLLQVQDDRAGCL